MKTVHMAPLKLKQIHKSNNNSPHKKKNLIYTSYKDCKE